MMASRCLLLLTLGVVTAVPAYAIDREQGARASQGSVDSVLLGGQRHQQVVSDMRVRLRIIPIPLAAIGRVGDAVPTTNSLSQRLEGTA